MKMSPDYASGNVVFNEDEIHDVDMIEGNLQVKGIEPGYSSPDDAPDADEGAWHYLNMHIDYNETDIADVNISQREYSDNRY